MHLELNEFNRLIGGRSTGRRSESITNLHQMISSSKKEQQTNIDELRTLTGLSK